MKICHVEMGRHLYGGGQQVVYLVNELAKLGVDQCVVLAQDSDIQHHISDQVDIILQPYQGEHDFRLLTTLRTILSDKQMLLHVHSRRGADWWGSIAARMSGNKSILTRRVDNIEQHWLAKLKFRGFSQLVAISTPIQQQLSAHAQLTDCQLIASSVDLDRFQPRPAKARDQQQPLTVGIAAQLIKRKGHHTLFKAISQARHSLPSMELHVYGQGPERQSLEQLAMSLAISDMITFHGFVSNLDEILPSLDLLVHPASKEGLGVILLQAAACKTPIVSTTAGGITDILVDGKSASLVSPDNADELAKAMREILTNDELRMQQADAAFEHVRQHHSIETMTRKYLDLYEQLSQY